MNRLHGFVSLTCLAALPATLLGADPIIGTPRAEVLAELGKPTAAFGSGSREVMMFSRGKVVLENGLASQVVLKTKEQYALEEKRRIEDEKRKAEEAVLRQAEEKRRALEFAERRKTGNEALTKLVDTPEWLKYTGDERIELLMRFHVKYPEADIAFEQRMAQMKRDREATDRNRITDLETRLAAAERRAAEAESRADEATRIATNAENRANEARQANTVYLPAPIVTGVCTHDIHHYRPNSTVVTIGNATITTTGGSRNCPPVVPKPPVKPIAPAPTRPEPAKPPAQPNPPGKDKKKETL